jgi:hypothetical protein
MDRSSIKDNLARSGFVFTDLSTPGGTVRITARGPQPPSTEGRAGERDTVVKVQRGSDVLHKSSHHNRATVARRYVELVEEHSA